MRANMGSRAATRWDGLVLQLTQELPQGMASYLFMPVATECKYGCHTPHHMQQCKIFPYAVGRRAPSLFPLFVL